MISNKDKVYIMKLVEKLTPEILKEISFNPNVKEVGHSFADRYEEILVKKLLEMNNNFTEPIKKRSSDDLKYKGNWINIKFGHKKNGQPNICSMKRLYLNLHKDIIDSYYILSVDANGPTYQFFDVYDYLDYTHFDYGTGQLMLCEYRMKDVYSFNDKFSLTKNQKIITMGKMMKKAFNSHIALKQKQQDEYDRILNGYKQNTL